MTTIRVLGLMLLGGAATLSSGATPKDGRRALEQRVDELEQKVYALTDKLVYLQKELANVDPARVGGMVPAPFVVVGKSGKPIFRVYTTADGGGALTLLTASGQEILWASALKAGGFFKTRSSASFPEVVMGSSGSFGGLAIRDGEGQSRATLGLTNGKPSLELSNDSHAGIASIMQGASGGGLVQLGNATGDARVQAGVTASDCGKVETFPVRPPAAVVGLPGSWILGKC